MQSLSKNQVCLIEDIVFAANINLSHLADDLIDHICSDVENEMNKKGYSFDEALSSVRKKFGVGGLSKIQEDTLLLTDKKYRFMKNSMKVIGTITLGLIGLSTVFKIMHWPGAGLMLVLGFLILITTFFPSVVIASYRSQKTEKNLLMHIAALIGGFGFMLGTLFKIMHWPGANIMLYSGYGFLLFVLLPVLLVYLIRKSKNISEIILFTTCILSIFLLELGMLSKFVQWPGSGLLMAIGSAVLLIIVLPWYTFIKYRELNFVSGKFIGLVIGGSMMLMFHFLLALNISKTTLWTFAYSANYATELNRYLIHENELLYENLFNNEFCDSVNISELKLIKNKIENIEADIYNISKKIIIDVDNTTPEIAEAILSDVLFLRDKDNFNIPRIVLYGENNQINTLDSLSNFYLLKNELTELSLLINSNNIISNNTKEDYSKFIKSFIEGYQESLYPFDVRNDFSVSIINRMKNLQESIYLIENNILFDLNNSLKEKLNTINNMEV